LLPADGSAASATSFRVFAEVAWFVAGVSVPVLAFSLHWQPSAPRFLNPAAFLVANPLPDSGEASFHQEFEGAATFVLVSGWVTIRLAPGSDI
jgi:hypothetical protein